MCSARPIITSMKVATFTCASYTSKQYSIGHFLRRPIEQRARATYTWKRLKIIEIHCRAIKLCSIRTYFIHLGPGDSKIVFSLTCYAYIDLCTIHRVFFVHSHASGADRRRNDLNIRNHNTPETPVGIEESICQIPSLYLSSIER